MYDNKDNKMKALALSIWLFINLIFFGMCGYMYLLWSQYWIAAEKEDEVTTNKYDRQIYYYNRGYSLNASAKSHGHPSEAAAAAAAVPKKRTKHSTKENVTVIRNSKPRFPSVQSDEFPMDTQRYKCFSNDSTNQCDSKVAQFKEKMINELKKVFLDEGNVLKAGQDNYYNVYYGGVRGNYMEQTPKDILCQLSKLNLPTLTKDNIPEGLHGLKSFLPRRQLFQNNKFNSCAVVSSAGSLKGSSLGKLIDAHELVVRFNNAPTHGYERDVGKKTNFRILNSQVMSKREYRFLQASMFRDMTILGWDPSNYGEPVGEWMGHPEFNLFESYVEFRRRHPRSRVYILNPESIWNVWDFLQSVSPNRLRRNPPSSGFLGISILLPHCDFIDVFEYVPSARVTKKCHYYDPEDNPSCTFGVWHPLAAEKLLSHYVNVADDRTVFQTGYIRIPGPSKLGC